MEEDQINETTIEAAIRYLKIHDPKNADRDYAIQLLESMQGLAGEIARAGGLTPEILQKALEQKKQQDS